MIVSQETALNLLKMYAELVFFGGGFLFLWHLTFCGSNLVMALV